MDKTTEALNKALLLGLIRAIDTDDVELIKALKSLYKMLNQVTFTGNWQIKIEPDEENIKKPFLGGEKTKKT